MYSRGTRLPVGVAAVVLAVTTGLYVSSGTPVPRPWYVFGGISVTLSALLFAVLRVQSYSTADIFAIGSVAVLTSVFLRFSAFFIVVTSGVDHVRWVRRVQSNIAAHGITGSDMYASAPIYLLELGIGQQLLALSAFETRFITLIIASVIPVVLGAFAYYLVDDTRVGLLTVLIAVPQFLFLRTSALLEAESLALLWYVLTMLLLARYLQTKDFRHFVLFSGFLLSTVFLHFLYAVILLCTVVGTLGLLVFARWMTALESPVSRETLSNLIRGVGAAALFIPAWILTSTYGGVAIDVLKSFFQRDTTVESDLSENHEPSVDSTTTEPRTTKSATESTTAQTQTVSESTNRPPQGDPPVQGGDKSLLDRIADFLLPQSGTVAQSIGMTGGSSGDTLLAVFPLVLFVGGGGFGALIAAIGRRKYDLFLLSACLTVGMMSVVSVFIDIQFQLGYRLYYFVGVLLVVLTAVGVHRLSTYSRRLTISLLIVVLFLPYAALGPASPLGNNVDPYLGGTDWRFTQSEYQQLESLNASFDDGRQVRYDVPQIPEHITIETNSRHGYITRGPCIGTDSRVGSAGAFSVCVSQR